MPIFVFAQYFFCSQVLFVYQSFYLLVYEFGGFLTIRLGKTEFGTATGVEVGEIVQFIAHTKIGDHGISLLGYPFQVVERTGRHFSDKQFFGGPATQSGTHFIQHLFPGGQLPFFWQVPGRTQGLTPRDNGHFDERMGKFEQPAQCGMTGFVYGNGTAFLGGGYFVLFFQAAYNTVHSVEKILFLHMGFVFAGSDQGRFVTDVGDVGTRKAGRLSCHKFRINAVVCFYGTQVYIKDLAALVNVGQFNIDLAIETAGSEQGLV